MRMARRPSTKTSHDRASRDDGEVSSRAPRGAPRGIWSGSISFGLLQIPVSLIPAESRSDELHFRLLDRRDLAPVRYERVSTSTGKPVEWKDIVKGYEIEKDSFVVIEPEDFAKANVKATQTIDIQDFVPRDQNRSGVLRDALLRRAAAPVDEGLRPSSRGAPEERCRSDRDVRAPHPRAPRRNHARRQWQRSCSRCFASVTS